MDNIDLDQTGGLSQLFTILIDTFRWGVDLLDHIMIGSFSLLDLGLGILIMGLVISVTLSTVRNYAGQAGSASNVYRQKKREKDNNNSSDN